MPQNLIWFPMKRERYERLCEARRAIEAMQEAKISHATISGMAIGLAPGGRIHQEIYDDPYELDAWDQRHASRCLVTIANSAQWMAMTGKRPPTEPPSTKDYTDAEMPWFDYYGGDAEAVEGAEKLRALASVAAIGEQKGETPLPDNESLDVERIIALRKAGASEVREMPARL